MNNPSAFVIEDDKNLALAFAEAVRDADYDVEVIYDGEIAKARLIESPPTLVILDLHIPHAGRTEILSLINSDARFVNTRVIVASADAISADELQNDADLVLLKPVGFRQLRDMATRLRP